MQSTSIGASFDGEKFTYFEKGKIPKSEAPKDDAELDKKIEQFADEEISEADLAEFLIKRGK